MFFFSPNMIYLFVWKKASDRRIKQVPLAMPSEEKRHRSEMLRQRSIAASCSGTKGLCARLPCNLIIPQERGTRTD